MDISHNGRLTLSSFSWALGKARIARGRPRLRIADSSSFPLDSSPVISITSYPPKAEAKKKTVFVVLPANRLSLPRDQVETCSPQQRVEKPRKCELERVSTVVAPKKCTSTASLSPICPRIHSREHSGSPEWRRLKVTGKGRTSTPSLSPSFTQDSASPISKRSFPRFQTFRRSESGLYPTVVKAKLRRRSRPV